MVVSVVELEDIVVAVEDIVAFVELEDIVVVVVEDIVE